MSDFTQRFDSLKADAARAADPHLATLKMALKDIDGAIDRLREKGFTVDVDWPYGRGDFARAEKTKVRVGLRLDL